MGYVLHNSRSCKKGSATRSVDAFAVALTVRATLSCLSPSALVPRSLPLCVCVCVCQRHALLLWAAWALLNYAGRSRPELGGA